MKASFIIPTYQNAAWLPLAVASAQKQTYPDLEIVIVDDHSTDSTPKYIEWLQAQDKRVKVIRNEKNLGRSASRNLGNAAATGDVLLVLDADDVATPNRAKLTVEKIRKGADFVYGSAEIIDALGLTLGAHQADIFNHDKALKNLVNQMVHSSIGYTREVAKRFPYRDGDISKLGIDDWTMQTEVIYAKAKLDFISPVICQYRHLPGSISDTRDEVEVKRVKEEFLKGLAALAGAA